MVLATTHFDNPEIVAEAQSMIDENKSMLGLDTKNLDLDARKRTNLRNSVILEF